MSLDPEMEAWAEDYRAVASDEPPMTAAAMLGEVAKEKRRERINWAAMFGGPAFAIVVFMMLLVRTRSTYVAVMAAVVLPALLVPTGYFVVVGRGRLREGASATVAEQVATMVARRRADVRASRIAVGVFTFLTLAFWASLPIHVWTRIDHFAAAPWRLAVALVASIVTFGGSWLFVGWSSRKTAAERARWEAIQASLEPPADPPAS